VKRLRALVEHPSVERFDGAVERVVEPLRGNVIANRVFYAASELGNHSIIWHIVNAIQTLLTRDARSSALVATTLGIESGLVNGPVKMLFRRERPEHDGERPHALRQPKTSSFPSGHATSAFCAAALFSRRDPSRRPLYYGLASVVAFSRIHVKIHHASDVVAGAAIGAVMGAVAKRIIFGNPRK
jgi:undecaprenyl-diphosphatase